MPRRHKKQLTALDGRPLKPTNTSYIKYECFKDGKVFCLCPGATRREAKSTVTKTNQNGNQGRLYWSCSNSPLKCGFWVWDDEKEAYGWVPDTGLFSPPASPAATREKAFANQSRAASSPRVGRAETHSSTIAIDSSDDGDDDEVQILSPSSSSSSSRDAARPRKLFRDASPSPKQETSDIEGNLYGLPKPRTTNTIPRNTERSMIAELQHELTELERSHEAVLDERDMLEQQNLRLKRKLDQMDALEQEHSTLEQEYSKLEKEYSKVRRKLVALRKPEQ